jgi:CheY-specific phosphatase CheX
VTIENSSDALATALDYPVEVVEAFTNATITAFEELTQLFVSAGLPCRNVGDALCAEVFAVVKLRKAMPGRLTLAFPRAVLEALARRYLPANIELNQEIVDDTAGEFANVIAGQSKTALKGTRYHFGLSTPVVSRGLSAQELEGGSDCFSRTFSTEVGSFVLHVHLMPGDD